MKFKTQGKFDKNQKIERIKIRMHTKSILVFVQTYLLFRDMREMREREKESC